MSTILIEPHYLPCIEYYVVLRSAQEIKLECHENYVKQSYRNRCRIMTAQGPIELSVPVLKPSRKIPLKDIKIDYGQKWIKDHWRSIRTAYGNAPFFHHFGPDIKLVYQRKHSFLIDLNLDFMAIFNKWLNLRIPISSSTGYSGNHPDVDVDWRSKIHPKNQLKINPFYKPCNYNQIFGKNFVGNLSIIDLLFCEGPSAIDILNRSKQ